MKVNIEVHLYEPATGQRGVEKQDHWGHDANPMTGEPYPITPIQELIGEIIYWWDEGNGGCSCNRSMSLDRALGQYKCTDACWGLREASGAMKECEHYPCGGRKIIIEKLLVNGELVYEEEEDGSRKVEEMVDLIYNGVKREVPLSRLAKEMEKIEKMERGE